MERSGEHRRASDTMAIKIPGRQLSQRTAARPFSSCALSGWSFFSADNRGYPLYQSYRLHSGGLATGLQFTVYPRRILNVYVGFYETNNLKRRE